MFRTASAGVWTLVSVFALIPSDTATGQLSEVQRNKLSADIRAAADQVTADGFPDVDRATQKLLAEARQTKRYFRNGTSAENAKRWLEFIAVDPVIEAIQSDASPAKISREASQLSQRLVGVVPGLELTRLRTLRQTSDEFVSAARFRDRERASAALARQLEALAERVDKLDRVPAADQTSAINAIIGLLAESRQAVPVVDAMCATYNQPNLVLQIGESIIQEVVSQPINEVQPVDDCILGTRIIGTAHATGNVHATLLPSQGSVRLQVAAVSHVVNNNVGYQKPITLNSIGHGDTTAWRTIEISEAGIELEPTQVNATLNTTITSINHRWRLVRRIAARQAAKQKPQVDRIALQKLRQRVASQFDRRTMEISTGDRPRIMDQVRPWLHRLDLTEPTRQIGSTESAAYLKMTMRHEHQLASVVPHPIAPPSTAAIQIHETFVDNISTSVLAGRTLKQDEVASMLAETGLPIGSAAQADDDQRVESFEIDFARIQPIVFEAREGRLKIGIRGTRFASGRRELPRSLEVTAEYTPAFQQDGSALLLRDGDVEVNFPGRRRLTVAQTGMRGTIERSFAKVFPQTLLHRPIAVPQTVKLDTLRGRQFRLASIDLKDGWFTVTLR